MEADIESALDRGFSGIVLLRIAGHRMIAARGWADPDEHVEITPSTRFNIASVTKLITAVTVCRLVERGTLGLLQSLAALVPDSGVPGAAEIRIEHLLTHTAGLVEEGPETVEDDVVGDQWLAAARTPRLFEPGTGWSYSNIGYGVLGAVIEQTTGSTFADVAEEFVLVPAGMTETSLREAPPDGSAIGCVSDVAGQPASSWRPAGSVGRPKPYGYAWSTVQDIERLVDAVASGALVERALRDRILSGKVETGQPGRRAGFGMFTESAGDRWIATLSGAGPGISAWLDVVAKPDAAYLAIVLSNRPKPAAHVVGGQLRRSHLELSSHRRPTRSQQSTRSEETAQP